MSQQYPLPPKIHLTKYRGATPVVLFGLGADGELTPLGGSSGSGGSSGTAPNGGLIVAGTSYTSTVDVTRPSNTTAYTAGDVLGYPDADTPANAGSAILEFAAIGPAGGHVVITDSRLRFDLDAVPSGMTSFRLHLYAEAPTAILDNAAWDLVSGDRAKYLGYIDLGSPADFGSTLFVQQNMLSKVVKLADGSTSLYGLLVTAGAYTPASGGTHSITLEAIAT